MWKVLIVFTFACNSHYAIQAIEDGEDGPIVEVLQGKLQGKYMETKNGRKFSAFTSIPFAKPPIGELRFQPPVPGDAWSGIRKATGIHAVCPQRDIFRRSPIFEGDEDCLYLNVYTPELPHDKAASLIPVMIFFHGGGWLCGGGNSLWYGPDILLDRDVVLVVPNYRLGALGFLSTGDEVSPGNNGMKDQSLAIKWVRNNIRQFGGNPDQITLFGESAGGASVQYHTLSPLSNGLFQYAISQSGTIQSSWAFSPIDQAVRYGKMLGQALDCPTDSSAKMVECLRKIDAMDIIKKDVIFMRWDFDPMIPFRPVVEPKHEGAFLDEHPIDLLKAGKAHALPWILGLNSGDGALRVAGIFSNHTQIKEFNDRFDHVVPISLLYDETAQNKDLVTKKIREFYFSDKEIDESQRSTVVDLYTDAWFLEGIDESIRLYRKYTKAPLYYYLFAHRGVSSFSEIFGHPEEDYGVCHADELQYLFPVGDGLFPHRTPSDADIRTRDIMTSLWTNFARTGNPTPETNDIIHDKWTPISNDDLEYYYIDAERTVMKRNLFAKRRDFWRNLPFTTEKVNYKDEL